MREEEADRPEGEDDDRRGAIRSTANFRGELDVEVRRSGHVIHRNLKPARPWSQLASRIRGLLGRV